MNNIMAINKHRIGLLLISLYIFMSFNANGIILPSSVYSISLYLLFLFWLFDSFTHKKLVVNEYSILYLVFMALSFFGMIYSPSGITFSGEFYLVIVSFVLTSIFIKYINDKEAFIFLLWVYSFSSFTLVILLLFSGSLSATAANRLGSDLMGNANTFAAMMMIATCYELWLLIYMKKKLVLNILIVVMILANMYALILSAGRRYFILPFIFAYLLFLVKTDKKGRRHIVLYTFLSLCFVVLVYNLIMNIPIFYETIGYRFELVINGIKTSGSMGSSADIRKQIRLLALDKWLESPLWGYGFDSFKYLSRSEIGFFFYSHCNYSELLYSGGIILFIVYYFIYYKLFEKIRTVKECPLEFKAFSIAVLGCMIISDYAGITFSSAIIQIMIALSFAVFSFNSPHEIERK